MGCTFLSMGRAAEGRGPGSPPPSWATDLRRAWKAAHGHHSPRREESTRIPTPNLEER